VRALRPAVHLAAKVGTGLDGGSLLLAAVPQRGTAPESDAPRIGCGVARPGDPPDTSHPRDRTTDPDTAPTAARFHTTEPPAGDLVSSPLLRLLLLALGWIAVAFGAIGVVLPGWPTTVWLLVAAALFARSSPRFYRWLWNHRIFGPVVRDVRSGRGLPVGTKVFAVSMITLFAGSSSVWLLTRSWVGGLVAAVGLIGIVWVLRQPTKGREA
jgi:uncharacterized membrane protein YbaN (DUF454 family)